MSWSALPFELKAHILEAYMDDEYIGRVAVHSYHGRCLEPSCNTECMKKLVLQPIHAGSRRPAAEPGLVAFHSILPDTLQSQLIEMCVNKLDVMWTTAGQKYPYLHMVDSLHFGFFLLRKEVRETRLFDFKLCRQGRAIKLYPKQPCPEHEFPGSQVVVNGWTHTVRD